MKHFRVSVTWTEKYDWEYEKQFYGTEEEYIEETINCYKDEVYVLLDKYRIGSLPSVIVEVVKENHE